MDDVQNILSDLIKFRTDTKEGKKKAVDYICRLLDEHQVLYQRVFGQDTEVMGIIAGINVCELKNIDKGLILSGHIDVVKAQSDNWQTDPFVLADINGCLYGRGTVDMKSFVAVVLSLIEDFKAVDYPIFLIFSTDEETDVRSIQQLISFMDEKSIHPEYALIGEPTNIKVCVAHNGYLGFTTCVAGKEGHSSRPDLGTNAIYAATKIISKIEEINARYQPLGTTLNVGVIQGGTNRNSIAGKCFFDWDIRYISDKHRQDIICEVEKVYEELEKQYVFLAITYEITEELPSFEKTLNNQFFENVSQILTANEIILPFATEAGFFQKYGVKTLVCGVGDENLSHTANECIKISDLVKYRAFLKRLICQLKL